MADPKFSIVVATRNRVAPLRRLIESLCAQTLDGHRFEIIIADDGSTDGTAALLTELAGRKVLQWIRLKSPKGAAGARNAGARTAKGVWIAFTDDDCVVPPDWLARAEATLAAAGADAVGGAVHNAQSGLLSEVYQDMSTFLFGAWNSDPENPRFLTTNNFVCSRHTFTQMNGFDESFRFGAEDRDLVRRLARGGWRVAVDPSLVVEHFHVFTLGAYLSHLARQGSGSWLFYRRHGASQPKPAAAGLLDLIRFAGRGPDRKFLRRGAAALGQAAVAAGYFRALLRGK